TWCSPTEAGFGRFKRSALTCTTGKSTASVFMEQSTFRSLRPSIPCGCGATTSQLSTADNVLDADLHDSCRPSMFESAIASVFRLTPQFLGAHALLLSHLVTRAPC